MDLYKDLNLQPVRLEPDVWVSRIMILERITPSPVVIRDIPLSRGLNIIWAEEAEDDNAKADITGHSAGKTTFCRLFRYVLGERTFGTKAVMSLIRKEFPDGYIAAEIHVRERKWAVGRPFESGRKSFIKDDATVEELLEQRGRTINQEAYPKEIGLESLLDELETGQVVQTEELIRWSHILAWCTRDQEARFQSIHDWRSPRSEADTPSFRFPKAGPLFVMRAVLGLFLPDELKSEERLAELQRDKDRLTKEIEDKRREPQFRVQLHENQLRQRLKSLLPNETDIDSRPVWSSDLFTDGLERLNERARRMLEESIKTGEQERKAIQFRVDDLGAELRRQEEVLARLDALFALDEAATQELGTDLSKREELRKKFNAYKNNLCQFGGILVGECSHVEDLQRMLHISEFQDSRALEGDKARREVVLKNIEDEQVNLREEIVRVKGERQAAIEDRDDLGVRIQEQKDGMREIEHTYSELVKWTLRRDKRGRYEDLDLLRREMDLVEKEIAKIETELGSLIRQHDKNRKQLAAIFSGAVKSVLSSEGYDGRVSLEDRQLAFRITHGSAMSGEAVDTLSVLLADVSALIFNTVSPKGHLPGFLLHDSPREADLGIGIYKSFIRFVASLQEHFGGAESCPFQYLITTTTAPPKELRTKKYLKLLLNASTPEGLLLCRNIGAEIPQQRLIF